MSSALPNSWRHNRDIWGVAEEGGSFRGVGSRFTLALSAVSREGIPPPGGLAAAGEHSFEPRDRRPAEAQQNRRGRTIDRRDVAAGRELLIKNLGRGLLDHGKGSGERGCVCFHRHNK